MIGEALSAQLVSRVGVGIALAREDDLTLTFYNPTFARWFGEAAEGASIEKAITTLDIAGMRQGLAESDEVTLEARGRKKRRPIEVEITVRRVTHDGEPLLVLECQNISRLRETEAVIDSYAAMVARKERELEREKMQAEKLLLNVMPRSVYEEYCTFGSVMPRLFEPVSVLVVDFVGFTEMAVAADPTVTVSELNDIFTAFDRIAELHGCERIKTLGDAYILVAGLPHPNPDHVRAVAHCAVKMMRFLARRNETHPHVWRARMGLASGPVVGSVVGVQKYVYDVFGPPVNCASRLQQCSQPMEITVQKDMAYDLIDEFSLTSSRVETLRGFGEVEVATLSERRRAVAHRAMLA